MFDMVRTGNRIAEARRKKDMTQMELAEKLGISFQAVSSWERGNTMPDIAKLPEIAEILGVSVDYLLGDEAGVAKGVIEGDLPERVISGEVSVDEVAEAIPVMKPSEIDSFAERVAELSEDPETKKDEKSAIAGIMGLFPFIGDETREKLFARAMESGDSEGMTSLLPFIDEEVVGKYAAEAYEKYGVDFIRRFLPHMSEKDVGAIAVKECEKNGVDSIRTFLPFMEDDEIDKLAKGEYEKQGIDILRTFLPFMSDRMIDEIAKVESEKNGFSEIKKLAPFMGEESLDKLIRKVFLN